MHTDILMNILGGWGGGCTVEFLDSQSNTTTMLSENLQLPQTIHRAPYVQVAELEANSLSDS